MGGWPPWGPHLSFNGMTPSPVELVRWRRHLHAHPGLTLHEEGTAAFVLERLQEMGVEAESGIGGHGIVATIHGRGGDRASNRSVGLRADMDALPIQELNPDLPHRSTISGVMHACGHDGHTAMLLGTAKILSEMRDCIRGEVRFLFQHAEELYPGGAQQMVDEGVMEGVNVVIGTHLWAPLEIGKIGVAYGAMMGSPDTFWITIKGKGGHGAMPHQAVDSIAIGAQVVTNLQHVVSRNTDPIDDVVVSVTKFTGGTTHNVIPGCVEMLGTVRTLDPEVRKKVPEFMERVVKGITEAHGASYEFKYQFGFRPVVNDEEVTRMIEETVQEVFGEETLELVRPNLGGEDFSALQQAAPGTFFWVGAGNKEKGITYPHHHPRFTIDEDALPYGVKMFLNATFKLLNEATKH